MRLFLGLLIILSTHLYANSNGQLMSSEQFNFEYNLDKSAVYFPWINSMTTCSAYTFCPNGKKIWCTTFGASHVNVPAHLTNNCRSGVILGQAVRCQGYIAQRDFYGRTFWGFVDIPVSCF